ncbi:MAG: hypothetical protein ABW195_02905, partial [Ilumatobacteraceae bacterium]
RNRFWVGGAAALGAGVLLAGPLSAAAQDEGDDWVADALSGLVTDGTLTQQQADAVDEALDAARPTPGPAAHDEHEHGGPGHVGPDPAGHIGRFGVRIGLEEAATAIGIEPDELRDDLRDGQTIAEVAEANGVETQAVIDAMVAAAKTRIDEAVTDGRIDDVVAAERLDEATERITTFVQEGLPAKED